MYYSECPHLGNACFPPEGCVAASENGACALDTPMPEYEFKELFGVRWETTNCGADLEALYCWCEQRGWNLESEDDGLFAMEGEEIVGSFRLN